MPHSPEPHAVCLQHNPVIGIGSGHSQASLPRRLLRAIKLWKPHQQRASVQVAVEKTAGEQLGISLAGGGVCARVSGLRPGSAAHTSDLLSIGDYITAVNGVRTEHMRCEQVANLLQKAEPGPVNIELQYQLPTTTSVANTENPSGRSSRVVQVSLQRDENGSLGFTIRGGAQPELGRSRPLLITQVREDGPAYRSGCVRAGDRLIAVNGNSMLGASLRDAHAAILRDINGSALVRLGLEVDVMEPPPVHVGPFLVEVARVGGDPALGLALAAAQGGRGVVIAAVRPGSVSDRCGALHAGDRICAVGGVRVDDGLGPMEAAQLLANCGTPVHIEVAPANCWSRNPPTLTSRAGCPRSGRTDSCNSSVVSSCGRSTLTLSHRGHMVPGIVAQRAHQIPANSPYYDASDLVRVFHGVSHSENLTVTLSPDLIRGYGISLESTTPPVISAIEAATPADTCGCLQPGDRLLEINHMPCTHLSGAEALRLFHNERADLHLLVEFDVADAVVPTSGVFTVKLARRGTADLGIFLSAHRLHSGLATLISEIRRGSVAHRSGVLHPGDQLLEVGGTRLHAGPEAAAVLKGAARQEVVTLRVLKGVGLARRALPSQSTDIGNSLEIHTVDLLREDGSNLGLTIAGTEDTGNPITISALTPGGLAERSGALFVGDRLISINGHCLLGRRLSDAVEWVQTAGDRVNLEVIRGSTYQNEEDLEDAQCGGSIVSSRRDGSTPSCLPDVYQVTLYKDRVYEDFGFSVSDGLYERGVYINRMRPGGPADLCGLLRPYDRILQVNDTRTLDFDCCLTVPLIAAAGDSIELTVARNPFAMLPSPEVKDTEGPLPWLEEDTSTLTKTL